MRDRAQIVSVDGDVIKVVPLISDVCINCEKYQKRILSGIGFVLSILFMLMDGLSYALMGGLIPLVTGISFRRG